MQGFEKLLILGEPAARLVNCGRKGALFLFSLFQVDLGDLDPPLLRLIVGEAVQDLLLLLGRAGNQVRFLRIGHAHLMLLQTFSLVFFRRAR